MAFIQIFLDYEIMTSKKLLLLFKTKKRLPKMGSLFNSSV